ncbi:MAG: HDOD domain-containing protein [Phycisphaerales bacterium]|jgi:two-component system cell cycle response regulator|nr:HDOD domain-containing protein [Phycisphaerales bacterium]
MNSELLEKVLSCQKLPSMPAIAARVIELTGSETVSMREIANTITNDQGLAAKILRTVNSPFYALRKPCSSINQAIVMLGLSAVKTLALGFSLVGSLAKDKSEGFDYVSYWRRGLLTAVAAKRIAAVAKTGSEEEAFLSGLLQDVGMIALYQALGEQYAAVLKSTGGEHRLLTKLEYEIMELCHSDIGAMLAIRWKLPPELVIPIKYHERPSSAPPEHAALCTAVALGNIAADVVSAAEPALPLKKFYERASQWLRMTPAQADAVLAEVTAGSKEIASLLGVDVGKLPDTTAMLSKAESQLRSLELPLPGDGGAAGSDADPVSGLPNRTIFNRTVMVGFERALAGGTPFSIALLGIDRYRELAAELGPKFAEGLVRTLAGSLATQVGAVGGQTFMFEPGVFAAALPGSDRVTATRCAESLRASIANAGLKTAPGPGGRNVTVSAGVACIDAESRTRFQEPDDLLRVTIAALDAARNAGPDIIRVYAPRKAA